MILKIKVVNLFFLVSCFVLILYLFFSTLITPLALNKSRSIISQNNFNSFLPTIRIQQFSDSFEGFTFIVEKKIKNNIQKVFIHDNSNTLKNLTSEQQENSSTTIVAENGVVEEKKMILFNGQIISSRRNNSKNEIIKFEQLNIDLKSLQTGTIKQPKLQETSTLKLLQCINDSVNKSEINCKENTKKEITTVLNRRIVLPFYIPVVSLFSPIC